MGRQLGLRVLGTAGSKAGLELVKEHGAEAVFNHHEQGYTQSIMVGASVCPSSCLVSKFTVIKYCDLSLTKNVFLTMANFKATGTQIMRN